MYRLQWHHNYTKKDETKQHYQIPPFSKLYTSQLQDKKVQSNNNRWIDKITRNSYIASAASSAYRSQVLYEEPIYTVSILQVLISGASTRSQPTIGLQKQVANAPKHVRHKFVEEEKRSGGAEV